MQEIKDQKGEQQISKMCKWCTGEHGDHLQHHCLKYRIIRWTLLVIILVAVFSLGARVGQFKSSFHRGSDRFYGQRMMNNNFGGQRYMMGNGNFGGNGWNYNQGFAHPVTQTGQVQNSQSVQVTQPVQPTKK